MKIEEITEELKRIKKNNKDVNPFLDLMMMYIFHREGTNQNDFERVMNRYRMTEVIEFAKIGRFLKELDKDYRISILMDINKRLNCSYDNFIIANF